jgi:mRNA interferase YafQ
MLDIRYSAQFKKDYKMIKKNGYKIKILKAAIKNLCEERPLPDFCRDHFLSGYFNGYRKCYVDTGWLLIYRIKNGILLLALTRIGTLIDLYV